MGKGKRGILNIFKYQALHPTREGLISIIYNFLMDEKTGIIFWSGMADGYRKLDWRFAWSGRITPSV